MIEDHRVAAMGSTARLFTDARAPGLHAALRARLHELEARWSRFVASSDVSRANAAAGTPVRVSADTVHLVSVAADAASLTRGWFDPMRLADLCELGYDRPFRDLPPAAPPDLVAMVRHTAAGPNVAVVDPPPTPAELPVLDRSAMTVTVPTGRQFDPGGIGKGLAADLVSALAVSLGARAVLVDVGGDLVCAGRAPDDGWVVDVEDPHSPGAVLCRLRLPWGAVATSSRLKRRWRRGDREAHHLVDPRTGLSSTSEVVQATVVAGAGWVAEACAKAALLAGVRQGIDLLDDLGVHGLLVAEDGSCHRSGDPA